MSFKKGDFAKLKLRLGHVADVPIKVANGALQESAQELRALAVNMAPVDESDLRRSIKVRRLGGGRDTKGRFVSGKSTYEVYIDMLEPVLGSKKKEVVVGQYAWLIHTHMGWASRPAEIMPSEFSQAAGAAAGVEAGGQFMDRSKLHLEPKIKSNIRLAVIKEIGKLDK